MSDRAIHLLCRAGLAVFTLYLLWVNQDYYRADTQTPSYDEAWYLETSLHLHRALMRGGVGELWRAYRGAFGVKAPLPAVAPLPFYLLFGPSRESALLVNSLLIAAGNLYLFRLGRRLFSPSAGLAAAVFFQTMPLAFGLSRSFMAEYGLAALVIVFLYYLAASEHLSRRREVLWLGVLLGTGLLWKVLFPAYIAGPLLLYLWKRRSWRTAAAIAAPAAAIAATWYAYNWRSMLGFAWESAYGGIAPDYGAGGIGSWALQVVNQGISVYYTVAMVVLGGIAMMARPGGIWRDERTRLLLAWLLPPLVALVAAHNQLLRYILPLLPVGAIVLAAAVFSLGRRWMAQAALALALAAYPQRLFAALTYRAPAAPGHAVRVGPLVLYARELGWARPPVAEDPWEHRRLLAAIRRLALDADRPFYAVLAIDHAYLNADLLNYLNAYDDYPVRFTSLGYGEASLARALERIYRLDARFLLIGEGFRSLPEFLNRLDHEIEMRAASGELPFRLRAEVSLAPPMKVKIYEREAPWGAVREARPLRSLPADLPDGLRFLGYDWKRRDAYLYNLTCYWTAREPIRQDYRIHLDVAGHTLDFLVTSGARPMTEWQPGEIIRETRSVFVGRAGSNHVEARLTVIPWGAGPHAGPVLVLKLDE